MIKESCNEAHPYFGTTKLKQEVDHSLESYPSHYGTLNHAHCTYSCPTSEDGSSVCTLNTLPTHCCLPPISELFRYAPNPSLAYPYPTNLYDPLIDRTNQHNPIDSSNMYSKVSSDQFYARYTYQDVYAPYLEKTSYYSTSHHKSPPPPPPPSPVDAYQKGLRTQDRQNPPKKPIRPWIPYYFHQRQFGIEACMDQLLEIRSKR